MQGSDVKGFTQCHFFGGIGGWSEALRLAGWPDNAAVWTGSCPCQPFSQAGKGLGEKDPRHLWPEFRRLIAECIPATIFGEQVGSKAGREWLAGIRADLEALGYAVGAADLCAASTGAPHIRQRLFWVADSGRERSDTWAGHRRRVETAKRSEQSVNTQPGGGVDGCDCCYDTGWLGGSPDWGRCPCCGLGDTSSTGSQERISNGRTESGAIGASPWEAFVMASCRDGKARRISAQPGDEPLAHGIPRSMGPLVARLGVLDIDSVIAKRIIRLARSNRVGCLRGYGNAIVPTLAAAFIDAYLETN